MRLIDADALMQTYAKFVAPSNNSDFENEPTWNDAVSLLESAPTVDAVEVVRCKDCTYCKRFNELRGTCLKLRLITQPKTIIVQGEKRKDESLVDIQSD